MPNWIVDGYHLAKLKGCPLACLICFTRHANGKGITRPGNDKLQVETGYSEAAVKRAVKRLRREGLILLMQKGGGRAWAAVYKITFANWRALVEAADKHKELRKQLSIKGVANEPLKPVSKREKGVMDEPLSGETATIKGVMGDPPRTPDRKPEGLRGGVKEDIKEEKRGNTSKVVSRFVDVAKGLFEMLDGVKSDSKKV